MCEQPHPTAFLLCYWSADLSLDATDSKAFSDTPHFLPMQIAEEVERDIEEMRIEHLM